MLTPGKSFNCRSYSQAPTAGHRLDAKRQANSLRGRMAQPEEVLRLYLESHTESPVHCSGGWAGRDPVCEVGGVFQCPVFEIIGPADNGPVGQHFDVEDV